MGYLVKLFRKGGAPPAERGGRPRAVAGDRSEAGARRRRVFGLASRVLVLASHLGPCADAEHVYYRVYKDGRQIALTVATSRPVDGAGDESVLSSG